MKALFKFNIFNSIKNKINKSKEQRELKKQEKLYIESLNPQLLLLLKNILLEKVF